MLQEKKIFIIILFSPRKSLIESSTDTLVGELEGRLLALPQAPTSTTQFLEPLDSDGLVSQNDEVRDPPHGHALLPALFRSLRGPKGGSFGTITIPPLAFENIFSFPRFTATPSLPPFFVVIFLSYVIFIFLSIIFLSLYFTFPPFSFFSNFPH